MEQVTPHLLFWINMKDCWKKKKQVNPKVVTSATEQQILSNIARGHWKIIWESRLRYYDGLSRWDGHVEVVRKCQNLNYKPLVLWVRVEPPAWGHRSTGWSRSDIRPARKPKKKNIIKSVLLLRQNEAHVWPRRHCHIIFSVYLSDQLCCGCDTKKVKERVSVINNVLHCGEFCGLLGAYKRTDRDAATKFSVYELLRFFSVAQQEWIWKVYCLNNVS